MEVPVLDLDKLSTEEHLELVERAWDALSRWPEAIPITDEQRRDLEGRLDELERNGPDGLKWEEVMQEARRDR